MQLKKMLLLIYPTKKIETIWMRKKCERIFVILQLPLFLKFLEGLEKYFNPLMLCSTIKESDLFFIF
jgi:hypothetical protein